MRPTTKLRPVGRLGARTKVEDGHASSPHISTTFHSVHSYTPFCNQEARDYLISGNTRADKFDDDDENAVNGPATVTWNMIRMERGDNVDVNKPEVGRGPMYM